jgi:hypothetical protein
VRHVDRKRDLRLGGEGARARAGEIADLLLHGRDRDEVARRAALLCDAAGSLERDVATHAVVDRAGGEAAAVERERRTVPDRGIADPHEAFQLVAVLGADVEEEILVLDRLALLPAAAAKLLQPRDDHARQRSVLRQHVDALADERLRVEPADGADGGDPVVAEVRDDDSDLVDVADHCERRPAGRARHAHPRAAEDVGRDLADGRGGFPPDGSDGVFLAGGTRGRQQAFEQLGERHGRRTLPAPCRATPR